MVTSVIKGGHKRGVKNHVWQEWELEIVRRDYTHTHASAREIGAKLGVSEYSVGGQISKMGLGKRSDRRPWLPGEDLRLRELIPRYCPSRVAKIMHRSINSVVLKSKRLGLSRRYRDGWFTKKEVCEIVGMDHKWVQRRIDCGAIKATYHHGHRPKQNGAGAWHIEEEDLVAFIRKYPQELNGRNVDLITMVDILAGLIS